MSITAFDQIANAARAVHGDFADAYVARLAAFTPSPTAEQVAVWASTLAGQTASPLPDAVIFDMDGTLVDVRGVRHYVTGEHRDFDSFHRASSFCPPNPKVAALAHSVHEQGMAVVVVTARKHCYRDLSVGWLHKYGVPFDAVFTRPAGDDRPDYQVKRDIQAAVRERFNVLAAVDDNPQVLALWDEVGIRAVVVPGFDPVVDGVLEPQGWV